MASKSKNGDQGLQLGLTDFPETVGFDYDLPGFLSDILWVAIQESHQLIAIIDIYESLQVYNIMTGDKVTMISPKSQDDEVLSRYKDIKPEFKRIYYNLHFIENNNKVCFVNGYRNEVAVYSIK